MVHLWGNATMWYLSPRPSRFSCTMLKSWEWPRDEATRDDGVCLQLHDSKPISQLSLSLSPQPYHKRPPTISTVIYVAAQPSSCNSHILDATTEATCWRPLTNSHNRWPNPHLEGPQSSSLCTHSSQPQNQVRHTTTCDNHNNWMFKNRKP